MHTKSYAHLPTLLIDRLRLLYPDTFDQIVTAFFSERATTFRRNSLQIHREELLQALKDEHVSASEIPWLVDAYQELENSHTHITHNDLYNNGSIYVQSLSSMIPALVLEPKPGEKILDLAAAPGSKTTQLAARMNNTGEIVANDSSRIRLYRLEANLTQQQVTNVTVLHKQAHELWELYPEYFDRTLVDVPCSMEGRMNWNDEKTYTDWSLKKIKLLAEKQKWMLRSGISATKPGGIILYSTCTLAPEENEAVIDWILKKEKGKVLVESIDSFEEIPWTPGLTQWGEKRYHESIRLTKRISPSTLMEGFFVAKLRKLESTVPSEFRSALS